MYKRQTQDGRKIRVTTYFAGQELDIALRAQNVIAGLRVPCLGQMRQCADADALGEVIFRHAMRDLRFECGVLVLQPVSSPFRFKLCVHACQYDGRDNRFGDVVCCAEFQSCLLYTSRCV